MPYAKRLILHAPNWDTQGLDEFVHHCLRDGVILVAVVGVDCGRVEEVIDELVVGDGLDEGRLNSSLMTTTSHPNETLDEVRQFAAAWMLANGPEEPVQEVWLLN